MNNQNVIKEVRSKLMSSRTIWVCGGGVNCAVRTLVENAEQRGLYFKRSGIIS